MKIEDQITAAALAAIKELYGTPDFVIASPKNPHQIV